MAFPMPPTEDSSGQPGMTLRDYFAAAALTGICARGFKTEGNQDNDYLDAVEDAYLLAAYMLNQRDED